ncbi:nitroreductase family protein [Pseudoalteromonas sp. AOP31-A2-14]|uniref:nitroreductase family protein n=1 Tax=Pseudoalteromonas sp. AOP31-A2-14 TaxID=3457695 RepID=UPI0040374C7B
MQNIIIRKARSFLFFRSPLGEVFTKILDLHHHLKFSFKENSLKEDKQHLKYYLTKHYHIIEKGLALPKPRLGFGQPKILDVIEKSKKYEKLFGPDELTSAVRKTLIEYLNFNASKQHYFSSDFESTVMEFIQEGNIGDFGGVKKKEKESSSALTLEEFNVFAKSRVSVRNFSSSPVPESLLFSAVDIAKSAPSVCNRQGWKVHCYSDKKEIANLLSHQNGNAGFTDVIDKLLIVTSDVKAFTSFESNQAFIDGGLFSMNLLLAIHAAGLGACCLNTCYPFVRESMVKKIAGIPYNERLIMMIGVGSLLENYEVAYSPRNPTEEIFTGH